MVLVQEQLNPTLRQPEQIERYFDVPILAQVPDEEREMQELHSRLVWRYPGRSHKL